jgi:hypothetical protein
MSTRPPHGYRNAPPDLPGRLDLAPGWEFREFGYESTPRPARRRLALVLSLLLNVALLAELSSGAPRAALLATAGASFAVALLVAVL